MGKRSKRRADRSSAHESTRSAVETAIKMSKQDKRSTWEVSAAKSPDRIARWRTKKSSFR
jgi:hypothetical protein